MVNAGRTAKKIQEWTLLRFFPSDPDALTALTRMICQMANNDAEVDWLIQRVLDKHNDWPGPVTIRCLFCDRFRPADGKDPAMPGGQMEPLSEADRRKVLAQSGAASHVKMLGSGEQVSRDPKITEAIGHAVLIQTIKDAHFSGGGESKHATDEEIAAAPEWLRRMEGF